MSYQQSSLDRDFFASKATSSVARAKNSVLRNTFIALAGCMIVATVAAVISMQINFAINPMIFFIAILGLSFAVQATADRPLGLLLLMIFAGLLGFNLGPILNFYLAANMGDVIVQAFGVTSAIFFGLTLYVVNTRKDFSFLGGFLTAFSIGLLVSMLLGFFFGGSMFRTLISGAFALFSSLMIMFEVSRVVNGGERNYIRATLSIFLSIYNLFVSLLSLLSNRE